MWGYFFFHAETEQGVAQAIIRSVLDFRRDPWPKVSDNAKDLVKRMLNPDPKQRLTAQEVLGTIQVGTLYRQKPLFFCGIHYFLALCIQENGIKALLFVLSKSCIFI